jgi:lactoylglutathione lyase
VKLAQVRLLVDDTAGCYRFYRDVLGLEPTFGTEGDAYASFGGGGPAAEIALFVRSGQAPVVDLRPPGDGSAICFTVDDLDAEVARVERAGGEFLGPSTARPDWGIRVAYLRDPAGNLLELHEQIPTDDA